MLSWYEFCPAVMTAVRFVKCGLLFCCILVLAISSAASNASIACPLNIDLKECPILLLPPHNCVIEMDSSNAEVIVQSINCKNINISFDDFQKDLYKHFNSTLIAHLNVENGTFDVIPQDAFANLSIEQVSFVNPGRRKLFVDPQAFRDLRKTTHLDLIGINDSEIPVGISHLSETLEMLRLEDGELKYVGTELQNMTQLIDLFLNNNTISEIHQDAFLNLQSLQRLNISLNNLTYLPSGIFRNLKSLKELYIQKNSLTDMGLVFFLNPMMIEILDISYNGFTAFPEFTNNTEFPNLRQLSVNNNFIEVINSTSLRTTFPKLVELDLEHNRLHHVTSDSLPTLLEKIDFSHNQIERLSKTNFELLKQLRHLDVSDNRLSAEIREFTPYLGNYVKVLNLSRNAITEFVGKTFVPDNNQRRPPTSLQTLDLSSNGLTRLAETTFLGLGSQLKTLILSNNSLTSLNYSMWRLGTGANARLEVFASYNRLKRLERGEFKSVPHLWKIVLDHNELENVEGAFANVMMLEHLDLSYNKLKTITEQILPIDSALVYLNLAENPIQCDCRFNWVDRLSEESGIKLLKLNTTLVGKCAQPKYFQNTSLSDLSYETLRIWTSSCPRRCSCLCVPVCRYNSRKDPKACNTDDVDEFVAVHINCSARNLEEFTDPLPPQTTILDLTGNRLKSLENITFPSRLQVLLLSGNLLEEISLNRRIHDLKHLRELSLSENPWQCVCQTVPFATWLSTQFQKGRSRIVKDIDGIKCSDSEVNGRLGGRLIYQLNESDLCSPFLSTTALVSFAVLGFLLITSSLFVVYLRYKLYIKLFLYTHGILKRWMKVSEEEMDQNKLFDAFISYSTVDENLVNSHILPYLESPDRGYFVCVHYKHFPAGEVIGETILKAVEFSKRTIILLSENFLQSNWCHMEFRSAYQQLLEDKMNRIIVIVYGQLPPKDELDPQIRMHIGLTTYLTWGERYFWEKLMFAMPKIPVGVNREINEEMWHLQFLPEGEKDLELVKLQRIQIQSGKNSGRKLKRIEAVPNSGRESGDKCIVADPTSGGRESEDKHVKLAVSEMNSRCRSTVL